MLKYPIPKEKRIALIKVYYHICTTPGMPTHIVSTCSDNLQVLTRSKKKLSIEDLRLPWKPVYNILNKDLFLTRRQFEIGCVMVLCGQKAEPRIHDKMRQSNLLVYGLHSRECTAFLPSCCD